jgi:hypothetical protein
MNRALRSVTQYAFSPGDEGRLTKAPRTCRPTQSYQGELFYFYISSPELQYPTIIPTTHPSIAPDVSATAVVIPHIHPMEPCIRELLSLAPTPTTDQERAGVTQRAFATRATVSTLSSSSTTITASSLLVPQAAQDAVLVGRQRHVVFIDSTSRINKKKYKWRTISLVDCRF